MFGHPSNLSSWQAFLLSQQNIAKMVEFVFSYSQSLRNVRDRIFSLTVILQSLNLFSPTSFEGRAESIITF